MFEQECVPFAPALIESMRSLGYSFSSAIADLIDNSISAHASRINIYSTPGSEPDLVIVDDGDGMSEEQLYEAMRYGSTNPLDKRDDDDLGRFGLGMKSASLSQCRRFVVVSKNSDGTHAYSWDLDFVVSSESWMLQGYSDNEIKELPMIHKLEEMDHGTYIVLQDFDRIKASTANVSETFNRRLNDMIDHLALVFHRYLDGELTITVNGTNIEPKDPFLSFHKATQKKRESSFYIDDEEITLRPYILPHLSKLTQDDLDKVGGKDRLRNDQGFYVYRNKRLIIWGTWFRLERKDELNKLARVMVDIPNSLDYLWSIDIKKSTAALPDIIKKNMYNAVYESVISSEAVHTYRGRKDKKTKDIDYVWERIKVREGYKYLINRNIPQLELLEANLDDRNIKLLNSILGTIESSIPINAIYVDAAKGNVKENDDEGDMVEQIWDDFLKQIEYVKQAGLSVREYCMAFLRVEPYCNHTKIKEMIQEEANKYE